MRLHRGVCLDGVTLGVLDLITILSRTSTDPLVQDWTSFYGLEAFLKPKSLSLR